MNIDENSFDVGLSSDEPSLYVDKECLKGRKRRRASDSSHESSKKSKDGLLSTAQELSTVLLDFSSFKTPQESDTSGKGEEQAFSFKDTGDQGQSDPPRDSGSTCPSTSGAFTVGPSGDCAAPHPIRLPSSPPRPSKDEESESVTRSWSNDSIDLSSSWSSSVMTLNETFGSESIQSDEGDFPAEAAALAETAVPEESVAVEDGEAIISLVTLPLEHEDPLINLLSSEDSIQHELLDLPSSFDSLEYDLWRTSSPRSSQVVVYYDDTSSDEAEAVEGGHQPQQEERHQQRSNRHVRRHLTFNNSHLYEE